MRDMSASAAISRRMFLRGASASAGVAAFGALVPGSVAWAAQMGTWPDVRQFTRRYVESGRLAGAVAAMGMGHDPITEIAKGVKTIGQATPVSADSLFRIYSMTKPITGMAAMILVDEGKLT
ncbi:MAG: serine hydrolase, partial [Novosphingobium sp.]